MTDDLPDDLARPRPSGRASLLAGVIVGVVCLGITVALLIYAILT